MLLVYPEIDKMKEKSLEWLIVTISGVNGYLTVTMQFTAGLTQF